MYSGLIGTHWGNCGVLLGLYRDNGKENGNYCLGFGDLLWVEVWAANMGPSAFLGGF